MMPDALTPGQEQLSVCLLDSADTCCHLLALALIANQASCWPLELHIKLAACNASLPVVVCEEDCLAVPEVHLERLVHVLWHRPTRAVDSLSVAACHVIPCIVKEVGIVQEVGKESVQTTLRFKYLHCNANTPDRCRPPRRRCPGRPPAAAPAHTALRWCPAQQHAPLGAVYMASVLECFSNASDQACTP